MRRFLRGSAWMSHVFLATAWIAAPLSAQVTPEWALAPAAARGHGIRLIVRGDDVGCTHSSDVAMEEGFESGVLTSASVFATCPWLAETAALARAHPDWSIGLHLTASSEWDQLRWAPVAPARSVPTLVADDGYLFHSYPHSPLSLEYLRSPPYISSWDSTAIPAAALLRRRQLTSDRLPDAGELEIELRAQIDRARRAGLRIDYLDCHMGIACKPGVAQVLVRLAKELCVPIPEDGWMGDQRIPPPLGDDLAARTHQFVGTLDSLKPGLYRVVIHPTTDSQEARAIDSYFGPSWARSGQMDVDVLRSREVRDALRRDGIQLVSVHDLWDYKACRLRP